MGKNPYHISPQWWYETEWRLTNNCLTTIDNCLKIVWTLPDDCLSNKLRGHHEWLLLSKVKQLRQPKQKTKNYVYDYFVQMQRSLWSAGSHNVHLCHYLSILPYAIWHKIEVTFATTMHTSYVIGLCCKKFGLSLHISCRGYWSCSGGSTLRFLPACSYISILLGLK